MPIELNPVPNSGHYICQPALVVNATVRAVGRRIREERNRIQELLHSLTYGSSPTTPVDEYTETV